MSASGEEPLPEQPFALSNAVGSAREDALYIAGVDAAGAPQLLHLSPITRSGLWAAHAGWPNGGTPTSLVAQGSRIYLTLKQQDKANERLLRWSARRAGRIVAKCPARSSRDPVARSARRTFFISCAARMTASPSTASTRFPMPGRRCPTKARRRFWPPARGTTASSACRRATAALGFEAAQLVSGKAAVAVARLDHRRRLPRRRCSSVGVYFYLRARKGSHRGLLRRQPHDPVLGGGREPVRDEHQLDQLRGDSCEGVRDRLAVHDEQDHDRDRTDVRRRLDRAAVPPAESRHGLQLPRDALPFRRSA